MYQEPDFVREDVSLAVSLSKRTLVGELMDDPLLPAKDHHQALNGLRRVNQLSRTAHVISSAIVEYWKASGKPSSLKILDLACGGGDVTVHVAEQLRKSQVNAEVHGWDLSRTAIDFAEAQQRGSSSPVQFAVANALAENESATESEKRFDIVYCTLFLHHLSDNDAEQLLKSMWRMSRGMVLIDDLRRSTIGYALAIVGCQLLSRSPIVHVDGPLSVRAAFTEAEILELSDRCRLPRPTIKRHWPHRFLLKWMSAR